jgi:hypothetical protein
MIYNHDARNLHFDMKVTCSDGRDETVKHLLMGK